MSQGYSFLQGTTAGPDRTGLTSQSDVGLVRSLLLKHPRQALGDAERIRSQWRDLDYVAAPDLGRALEQYAGFAEAIRALAPDVQIQFLPDEGDLSIDSLYVRDAPIACDRGMILCNKGEPRAPRCQPRPPRRSPRRRRRVPSHVNPVPTRPCAHSTATSRSSTRR
jgi:hypothetical protein